MQLSFGKNYISLSPEKDVITAAYDKDLQPCDVQGSLIDMRGFDIFKYLKLLLTSNPTTIEWLNALIVYYGDNNLPLREYMRNNFNQERLLNITSRYSETTIGSLFNRLRQ